MSTWGKWPERFRTLFRPDRLEYLKKNRAGGFKNDCVFCDSLSQGVGQNQLVLYTAPRASVILNKYPYNNGHLLVLPTRHEGELVKLERDEQSELYDLMHRCVAALQKSYQCPGMNIGLNLGSAAGAGIPQHLHWHLVPRWSGDMNFFPVVAESKVIPETLEQTFQRLLPYFNEI